MSDEKCEMLVYGRRSRDDQAISTLPTESPKEKQRQLERLSLPNASRVVPCF